MLSVKQQKILIKMLANEVRGSQFEISNEYKQNSNFYRSMYYLQESGLISILKERNGHRNVYELTNEGEALAKALCLLSDIPPRLKELYETIYDDELTDDDINEIERIEDNEKE